MAESPPAAPAPGVHEAAPHVLPVRAYARVYVALLALTVLTVAASLAGLGSAAIFVALTIATVKAGRVAGWFMHLRFEARFHSVVVAAAALFLALFLGLTWLDVRGRGMVDEVQDNFVMEREAAGPPGGGPAAPAGPRDGGSAAGAR